MVLINAADLRHRLTLQSPPTAVDAMGRRTGVWNDERTVWGAAWPIRGREWFEAGQVQSDVSVRFRIRWREGVLPSWRVLWRGVAYAIVGEPIDVEGARVALDLMCTSGERDAA